MNIEQLPSNLESETPSSRNNNSDNSQNRELMKLVMGLNQSVSRLVNRFETFEGNIEIKVNKLQSEFVLLKNKVEFLESNAKVQLT
jgi:hypothetical protein